MKEYKTARPGDLIRFTVDLAGGGGTERFSGIGVVLEYEYEPQFFMFAVLTGTAPYQSDGELPFPHGIYSGTTESDYYTIIRGGYFDEN